MNIFKSKKLMVLVVVLSLTSSIFSFEKGWVFGLRADFGGTLTIPSISDSTLKYMNPDANKMTGTLSGFLMGAETSLGYVFDSHELFGIDKDHTFSGIKVGGYLGFGQGNMSQKISATPLGQPLDIFIIVDYLPVISFGVEGEALFFDNKLAVGLGLGAKAIVDMTPQYLVYSTDPSAVPTEIGEIIVPEDMMTKMNPLSFSLRFKTSYAIPVLPTTEFVIGFLASMNFYSPGYLTVPPSLANSAELANTSGVPLDFKQPFPDYWLNTFDFGVNVGFMLKI